MTIGITMSEDARKRLPVSDCNDHGHKSLRGRIIVQSRINDNDDPRGVMICDATGFEYIKIEP